MLVFYLVLVIFENVASLSHAMLQVMEALVVVQACRAKELALSQATPLAPVCK